VSKDISTSTAVRGWKSLVLPAVQTRISTVVSVVRRWYMNDRHRVFGGGVFGYGIIVFAKGMLVPECSCLSQKGKGKERVR
jgi:hypothetical protein